MARSGDETNGPVVLITGGGSGLGKKMAGRFQECGMRVVATVRGEVDADAFATQHTIEADMAKTAALPAVVDRAVAHFGRLDVVVCNAAVQGFGHVEDIDLANWEACLAVNLTAPFMLAKAAVPHLKKQGGLIVFVSSVHGVLAAPSRSMYAATKAGLIALARNLAADLSLQRVRAVALVLGPFESPALVEGISRFFPDDAPEVALSKFAAAQNMPRVGDGADLADFIAFLASDAGAFINGTAIAVDGGMSSRLAVPPLS